MPGVLTNSVAVVTGGGQGIGLGISEALLKAGAMVVIGQRSAEQIGSSIAALEQYGAVVGRPCDASKRSDVEALFDFAIEKFGTVDILAANHGISPEADFLDITDEDWDKCISINLKGMFICGQVAARHMVERKIKGRIILTSSICASAAEPRCAHYNASKGGVSALCKSMAVDLARYGIVTNAVAPGWILTPATDRMVSAAHRNGTERFPHNAIGKIGLPEDIGNAVVWLADPKTTYVSGAVVTIDGAQTAALSYPDAA